MKRVIFALFIFSSILLAESKWAVFSDYGRSRDKIDVYRIGVRYYFSDWLHQKGLSDSFGGYFEGSLNYWNGKKDNIFAVAISPVFYYQFNPKGYVRPYIEGGIGATYISKTKIDNRNLSIHFQFEDRIGIGVKVGDFDFHIRYMHYSNANLKKPNNGIDIYMVGISYSF